MWPVGVGPSTASRNLRSFFQGTRYGTARNKGGEVVALGHGSEGLEMGCRVSMV